MIFPQKPWDWESCREAVGKDKRITVLQAYCYFFNRQRLLTFQVTCDLIKSVFAAIIIFLPRPQ